MRKRLNQRRGRAGACVLGWVCVFLACEGLVEPVGPTVERDAGVDGAVDAGGQRDAGLDAGAPDAGPMIDAGLHPVFDWFGIIGTGQSLSVGCCQAPPRSTTASFNNLKLDDTGSGEKFPSDGGGTWVAVPLKEPIRSGSLGYSNNGDEYPTNIYGETPHTAMATQLTVLATKAGAADYVSVHSVVGWSGHVMSFLDKQGGFRAYPGSLNEARAFKTLAAAAHKTFGYGAIVLTHGESDNTNAD